MPSYGLILSALLKANALWAWSPQSPKIPSRGFQNADSAALENRRDLHTLYGKRSKTHCSIRKSNCKTILKIHARKYSP